jgi:L-histidine Nalpha-methyltransferase
MPRATRTEERQVGQRQAAPGGHGLLADVLSGLHRRPRSLPSSYFYDRRGSRLFQWITNLPDYYLTRVESGILERHGDAMVAPLGDGPCTVVDLGAGDGHKTRRLLQRLLDRGSGVTYAPVDISGAALDEASASVRAELPGVSVRPVRATYAGALRQLARQPGLGPKLVLFLGSSIGNLEHAAARALLRDLRSGLRPGDHVLVGFDLVKPLPLLRRAYDDPQGVTGAFNLNLLARLNRELGARFDLSAFRHVATWDPSRPAMESWLESTRTQAVRIGRSLLRFEAGERIQTEISCKYCDAQITGFAAAAGFTEVGRFADAKRWFVDALWRADR